MKKGPQKRTSPLGFPGLSAPAVFSFTSFSSRFGPRGEGGSIARAASARAFFCNKSKKIKTKTKKRKKKARGPRFFSKHISPSRSPSQRPFFLLPNQPNVPPPGASSSFFSQLDARKLFQAMLARAPACYRAAPADGARRHGGPRSSLSTTPSRRGPMPLQLPLLRQAGRRPPLTVAPRSSLDDASSSSASVPGAEGEVSLDNGGGIGGGCPVLPFRSSSSSSAAASSPSPSTSSSSPSPADLPLPPGTMGFPILGESATMFKNPALFHRTRREKHGELRFFSFFVSAVVEATLSSLNPKKKKKNSPQP